MIPFALFTELIDALNALVCLIQNLAFAFAWVLTTVINAVIWSLGLVLAFIVAILPTVPDLPDAPNSTVVQTICWFVPMGAVLSSVVLWLIIYTTFLLYRVIAKWVKAL